MRAPRSTTSAKLRSLASLRHDAFRQAAYAHLGGDRDLAIVTGIAGADKSRLQRDVAAACEEAGFRVIGAAVAGDAARTLGEEADMDARTVAKLLVDLEKGRDRLDDGTVSMIDEAGTLGAAQSRELLERARDAGARVLLLGDVSQHESVGRGSVLSWLAVKHGALDMRDTRRASEEWLRAVVRDLRTGVVSRALDVLREKGAVREHATHDDARIALVRSWAEATRSGKSALLVASRNDDVRAMNELAREAVRASGSSAIGEERVYATDFGKRNLQELVRSSSAGNARTAASTAIFIRSPRIATTDGSSSCAGATVSTCSGIFTSIARSTTDMQRRRIARKGAPSMPFSPSHRQPKRAAGCTST